MNELAQLHALARDLPTLLIASAGGERQALEALLWPIFNDLQVLEPEACEARRQDYRLAFVVLETAQPRWDLFYRLRQSPQSPYLVALCPAEALALQRRASALPIDALLALPPSPAQLVAVLTPLLRRLQAGQAPEQQVGSRVDLEGELNCEQRLTLALIHLQHLASIRADYGAEVGDRVERRICASLMQRLPTGARAFRVNSEEFAILFEQRTPAEVADVVAELHAHLASRRYLAQAGIQVHTGIRSSVVQGCGRDLISEARHELSARGGAGPLRESAIRLRQRENRHWLQRLQDALDHGTLRPFFQPIRDNRRGVIGKFECLARIVEGGEIVAPPRFLSHARHARLLPLITRAVIRHSLASLRGWEQAIAFNLSDHDLAEEGLTEFLLSELAHYRLPPSRITLEVLETINIDNDPAISVALAQLRQLGFRIAVDDFGAEHSNFDRLLDLQADFIKIDGRFIRNLATNRRSQRICRAIKSLAAEMGAEVIAEHVHELAVQQQVAALGIEFSQGYLFGRPSPVPRGTEDDGPGG